MGRKSTRLMVLVAVIAALSGCGSRVAPDADPVAARSEPGLEAGDVTSSSPSAAPPPAGTGQAAAPTPGGEGPPVASGESDDDPSWYRTTPPPPPPGYNTVRVEPASPCVTPGSVQQITFHTDRPGSHLAMTVAYADYQAHGSHGFGRADAQGRFTWPVPIPPDAPPGQAIAMVSATGSDGSAERGGTGQGTFQVAAPGGCAGNL